MTIQPLNTSSDTFSTLYDVVNAIIAIVSDIDLSQLTTTDKSSLVAAINEVNAKGLAFYLADGSQSNILI